MIYKIVLVTFLITGSFAGFYSDLLQFSSQLCDNNHYENKTERSGNAFKNYKTCLGELVNTDAVIAEFLEDAQKSSIFALAFKKYCDNSEALKLCFNTAANDVAPCLDNSLQERLNDITTSSNVMIDFLCYKEGERVLLFMSENGFQCLESNAVSIQTCIENVPNNNNVVHNMSLSDRINRYFNEACGFISSYEDCIMRPLETCASQVAVDVMRSIWNTNLKSLNCKPKSEANKP